MRARPAESRLVAQSAPTLLPKGWGFRGDRGDRTLFSGGGRGGRRAEGDSANDSAGDWRPCRGTLGRRRSRGHPSPGRKRPGTGPGPGDGRAEDGAQRVACTARRRGPVGGQSLVGEAVVRGPRPRRMAAELTGGRRAARRHSPPPGICGRLHWDARQHRQGRPGTPGTKCPPRSRRKSRRTA